MYFYRELLFFVRGVVYAVFYANCALVFLVKISMPVVRQVLASLPVLSGMPTTSAMLPVRGIAVQKSLRLAWVCYPSDEMNRPPFFFCNISC